MKKLKDATELRYVDLRLPGEIFMKIRNIKPEQLISAAIYGDLGRFLIGKAAEKQIIEALKKNDFIPEFIGWESEASLGARQLISEVFCGMPCDHLVSCFEEYDDKRVKELVQILDFELKKEDMLFIREIFGLGCEKCPMGEIRSEFGISREMFYVKKKRILNQLRRPQSIIKLRGWYHHSQIMIDEIHRMRQELRPEVDRIEKEIARLIESEAYQVYGILQELEREAFSQTKSSISILEEEIQDCNLSARARNGLMRAGIMTVGDLLKTSELELKNIHNVGTKTLDEIYEFMYLARKQ